jgi:hypothetical protein
MYIIITNIIKKNLIMFIFSLQLNFILQIKYMMWDRIYIKNDVRKHNAWLTKN